MLGADEGIAEMFDDSGFCQSLIDVTGERFAQDRDGRNLLRLKAPQYFLDLRKEEGLDIAVAGV